MLLAPSGGTRASGFSLVEVMITMTVAVVGLLAVASATTSTSLLRKRGAEEGAVFAAMVGRLEWVRSQLYSDSAFHDASMTAIAAGEAHVQPFLVDADGDGIQDLSGTKEMAATPILEVTVTEDGAHDPDDLVRVSLTATWYGIGGVRTRNLDAFVANRRGFDD
ncbi:MAG: prepilin-type N-terminal cleavage/methylation domain-containing protein [Planctomycetota bacterium JB042]